MPDPGRAQDTGPITWKSAFVAGLEARRTAHTGSVGVHGRAPLELFLVLEGERGGGLPVYCTSIPKLRIAGRAVPKRMIVAPDRAGIENAEIRWQALRATDDARGWRRQRIDTADGRWSMELLEFPGDEASRPSHIGTMRFTAAISIPGSTPVRLETEGWSLSPDAIHPDEAPGFRVTRYSGRTLIGFAEGYSLLPVVPGLPESFARNKVALAPTDLVLAPYEDLGQVNLDPLRDFPLDAEEWSWLFETVADEVRRRSIPFGALVGPDSRGIRFGRDVQIGDILLVDGRPTILQLDEGNGWLDEGDRVLTTISGRVRFGPLAETPGTIKILRPRLFITLRERVKDAGYGHTGQVAWYTADLGQALREFQRDQGLPETGYPDAATDAALERLLTAMESVPSPPASGQ